MRLGRQGSLPIERKRALARPANLITGERRPPTFSRRSLLAESGRLKYQLNGRVPGRQPICLSGR